MLIKYIYLQIVFPGNKSDDLFGKTSATNSTCAYKCYERRDFRNQKELSEIRSVIMCKTGE